MKFKWLLVLVGLLPVQSAARDMAVLPLVPASTKPLPDAPQTDREGMPFVGFGYACKASAGEGEFVLSGTIDIDAEGAIGMANVASKSVAANPSQILGKGERSKEIWLYVGALRWRIYWLAPRQNVAATGPYFNANDGTLQFELTPERSLPKGLVISFTRSGKTALVADGNALDGRGHFFVSLREFLDYNGANWIVNKWPFQGSNIALNRRFGYGTITMDRITSTLANVEPLNRKFSEMLRDYKNVCSPVPYYENNDIVV